MKLQTCLQALAVRLYRVHIWHASCMGGPPCAIPCMRQASLRGSSTDRLLRGDFLLCHPQQPSQPGVPLNAPLCQREAHSWQCPDQVRADGGSVPWAPPAQHRLPEELGCGRGQQGLLESRRQAGTPAGAQPALQAQLVWLLPSLHVLWQYEVAGRPLAILSRGECPASSLLRQDTKQMSGSKAVPCVSCSACMG